MSGENLFKAFGRVGKGYVPTDADMALINAQAIEPLERDQVFVFRVHACNNDIDRQHERFGDDLLAKMAGAFVGTTIVKDHSWQSDNQIARIYDAAVEETGGATADGRPFKRLTVSCYMLDSEANAPMIAEIRAGIKREVSVSLSIGSAVCSVCGADRVRKWCKHTPGAEYDGEECCLVLGGDCDAYELSFVAVPAQREAGISKGMLAPEPAEPAGPEGAEPDGAAEKAIEARLRMARACMGISSNR